VSTASSNKPRIIEEIRAKAKAKNRHVVLPEGTEERTILAAKEIAALGMARVTLLGNKDQISKLAQKNGLDLNKVNVIDPAGADDLDQFVAQFVEMRKKKNIIEN